MANFLDILFNRKPKKPDFSNVESRSGSEGGSGGSIRPDFSRVDNRQTGSTGADFGNVNSGGADFRNVGSSVSSTEQSRSGGVSGYGGSASTGIAARTYTVASGDTLSAIAQRHYGNASRWPMIFEANRDKLSDPDKIFPGQVLRLPADDGRGH